MLPLSLLKTAQNHPMLVELKNGETYNGHLVSCDNWMNINLREVICTSRDGDKFWRMPECYIRGSTIKYLRIPDEIIDMVKEEVVSKGRGRGGMQQNKQQGKGRGGGAGRGLHSRCVSVLRVQVCLGVVVAACQEWAEASSSRRRSQVVPNLRESRISTEEIEAGYQREVYSRFHSMSTLLVRGHSGWCNSRPGSLC
uniref:U6 snRNA-associated Sm-like protein LSm4 n=1 Tax=Esox lucius TaxID=8010 RepID=A0AAY5KG46_ESOLU